MKVDKIDCDIVVLNVLHDKLFKKGVQISLYAGCKCVSPRFTGYIKLYRVINFFSESIKNTKLHFLGIIWFQEEHFDQFCF